MVKQGRPPDEIGLQRYSGGIQPHLMPVGQYYQGPAEHTTFVNELLNIPPGAQAIYRITDEALPPAAHRFIRVVTP